MTYTTINHPVSGETYAVELTDDGRMRSIAGPLHYTDPRDEDSLAGWISNTMDGDGEADAEWLRHDLAVAANGSDPFQASYEAMLAERAS